MAQIDTREWKEFRLGDLFNVQYGHFIPKTNAVNDGYPHVTTSAENNGYSYNVVEPMFPAGCISVASDGSMGATFYHDRPYSAGNIVSNLIPHIDIPMNRNIGLFLCSLIRQESHKYSWNGFKFSVDRVRETMLPLPATPDGQPDWAYMDAYMADIMAKEEVFANQLAAISTGEGTEGYWLDTSGWKAFRIGEMFEVEPMHHKLSKADIDDGCVPIYSSDSENYGILGYTSNDATYKITVSKPFFVVFGDHTCNMSVVQTDFCVADNVKVLSPKICIPETALLFLLTTWKRNIKKLGYARHWSIAKDTDIYLPATPDGTPDWAWMEQFMQQQMTRAETLAQHLEEIWQ